MILVSDFFKKHIYLRLGLLQLLIPAVSVPRLLAVRLALKIRLVLISASAIGNHDVMFTIRV